MNQPNTYCFIFFYLLIVFTRTFLNFALASSNQVSTNWSISQLLAFQLSQNKIYCRVQEFTLLFSWKSIKTSKNITNTMYDLKVYIISLFIPFYIHETFYWTWRFGLRENFLHWAKSTWNLNSNTKSI